MDPNEITKLMSYHLPQLEENRFRTDEVYGNTVA